MAKIFRETYEGLSKQQQVFVAGAAVLATAGVACGAAWWWYRKKTPTELVFKPVGKLSTIFIHPIKSCRGQEVTMAECTPTGLRGDNGLFDRYVRSFTDHLWYKWSKTSLLIGVSQPA